jgi:hypothetical protein
MQVRILYSTRENGPMTGNKIFYKEGMSREEIQADLLKRRNLLGELYGFSGTKIIVPAQDEKFEKHQPGQLFDATEFVCDNEDQDLWNTDEYCDIMLVRSEVFGVVPNLALAYPVSDCPVLIITTPDTVSISHCGGAQIDRELPLMAVEAVREATDTKYEDIGVYVGPCAQSKSYVYDNGIPKFVKNEKVWADCVIQTDPELVRIDMRTAIYRQIGSRVCRNLLFSDFDTVTDDRFYSNCAGRLDPTKNGRHLVGAYCKSAYRRR